LLCCELLRDAAGCCVQEINGLAALEKMLRRAAKRDTSNPFFAAPKIVLLRDGQAIIF
jgi:hypothetical protein